jgi:hypothetical protein
MHAAYQAVGSATHLNSHANAWRRRATWTDWFDVHATAVSNVCHKLARVVETRSRHRGAHALLRYLVTGEPQWGLQRGPDGKLAFRVRTGQEMRTRSRARRSVKHGTDIPRVNNTILLYEGAAVKQRGAQRGCPSQYLREHWSRAVGALVKVSDYGTTKYCPGCATPMVEPTGEEAAAITRHGVGVFHHIPLHRYRQCPNATCALFHDDDQDTPDAVRRFVNRDVHATVNFAVKFFACAFGLDPTFFPQLVKPGAGET